MDWVSLIICGRFESDSLKVVKDRAWLGDYLNLAFKRPNLIIVKVLAIIAADH